MVKSGINFGETFSANPNYYRKLQQILRIRQVPFCKFS
ncbi:hypothetical protein CWATWH8502_1794 [Crocosphaera watsonii WH 8502]|uniref:Uncharacterized protein n=1 Tax=Crocosphaera watsonii WH 8502 TaxID=423474 RepID=T2IAP0_CROWT|nr:hypothetical protein CWATWH8502_1794 [Crocosphaera watsonii WH 8502]